MKDVNLETTTDTQSWYKILPLSEYNLIRIKRKLLRRRKGVSESFSSRRKSRNSFIQTLLWDFANLVQNYHGIIELQQSADPRRKALLREQYAE